MRAPIVLGLLLPLVLLQACGARAVEPARTFYIDFANGSDQASGASQSQAWRRAPGDPQATGNPAHEVLRPGDVVVFRGGVTYRGALRFKTSGEAGRPITYRGEGFGAGHAIMSGRDAFRATAQPCASTPACAGLPAAADLRVIDLPAPVAASDQIVVDGHLLELAQAPEIPDAFWYDDLAHYQTLPKEKLTTADKVTWRLQSDFLRKSLGAQPLGDLVVHLWGISNAITSVSADTYDAAASELTLKADKYAPYTDRPELFALANHPALIRRPYQFATVDHGARIVVQAPLGQTGSALEISKRAAAFDVAGQKHLVVEGFEIVGYAGGAQDWGSGAALLTKKPGAEDIVFRHNNVHDLTSWAGVGAVHGVGVIGLTVADNRFERLWRGAGVIVSTKSSDIRVLNNTFEHIGRVGVAVLGADRVWIDHNRLANLYGHHGNGIAIYLDNHDVLVSNNLIREATRTFTFQGGPGADNLVVRHNLLLASGKDGSTIQSWGTASQPSRRVTIEGNVMIVDGGPYALKLNAHDIGLVVRRNLINGVFINGTPTDWTVRDNLYTADNYHGSNSGSEGFDALNKFSPGKLRAGADLIKATPVADPAVCRLLTEDTEDGKDAYAWLSPEERRALSAGVGPSDLCKP